VDSGNLAGALIALAQGMREVEGRPQTVAQRRAGLADTADLLAEATATVDGSTLDRQTLSDINRLARAVARTARGEPSELGILAVLDALGLELTIVGAGLDDGSASGGDVAYWHRAVLDALRQVASEPPPEVPLAALAARMTALADAMRFDFLYDRRRRIFSIGYRLPDAEGPGRHDASFYDLLASEARLASFVAIAKGDVPQHHWFHLGRLVTNVDGRATLMSWGGTMFEYLMPQLLMRTFAGTLLDQSCRASVRRQIDYGRQRRVPWGISESAYAFTDREGNYQYRAFGVPGLGLKRGLSTDLVIAPYATALAGLVTPSAAAENLERLAAVGLEGRFGFYEALDYNPRGRDDVNPGNDAGPRPAVVRAYFAHHQGMSLVALANVICHDTFVSRFHADPRVQATELLLQERVPREAILSEPRPAESTTAPPTLPVFATRRFRSPHSTSVHTQFLSNGRYTAAVTNGGGSFSVWRDTAITRRRDDPTSDGGAHFIYLRDPWSSRVWSATYHPVCEEPDRFDVTFDLDRATFRRRDGDIETQLEMTVSSEDDVEVRRLTIANRGTHTREIEVTSYAEIVLGPPEDDLAHPAFGKLFVESQFDPQSAGLLFHRRPRGADESPIVGFHVLGVDGPRLGGAVEWETDRARFIGRGRSTANPIALDGRALSGTTGAVLDPDWRAARAHPSGTRRSRACELCDRRRARWRGRTRPGAEVPGRQRRRARLLDGVHTRPYHAAESRAQRRAGDSLRSAGVARLRNRCVVPQPGCAGGQYAGAAESVGTGHLRRPADRAAARRRGLLAAARPAGAQRAGVLAGQGAARRRRHPERAPGRLPRRDAGAADAAGTGGAVGRPDRQAGRRLSAARRRHGGTGSSAALGRGAGGLDGRSRRPRGTTGTAGGVDVRRT
jgi:hypothetical protein